MNPYELAAQQTAKLFDTDLAQTIEIKRIKSEEDIVSGEVRERYSIRGDIRAVKASEKSAKSLYENRFGEGYSSEKIRYYKVAAESVCFEPQEGDIGMIECEEWECLGMSAVQPADIAILFNVGFRRR